MDALIRDVGRRWLLLHHAAIRCSLVDPLLILVVNLSYRTNDQIWVSLVSWAEVKHILDHFGVGISYIIIVINSE